ncbi:MAG: alpha-1,4 polygalactosaminidase [Cenarchaeum sp. SB0663_bin_5]|nr:alpha-1,4 polygalactosaminidase [Cenarchaeum sp. SB0663_bin_5]MYL11939.1 alpha-1,4 polygalactosaminidase [Cenarchaeum sp. SB0669_bin_11]
MQKDREIIVTPVEEDERGVLWQPDVGPEACSFLAKTTTSDRDKVALCDAGVAILRKSLCPADDTGHRTGLVIGYIQSGKTTSIGMVAALARDNGYRVVIVVVGVSTVLLQQSTRRLRNDLGVNDGGAIRRWRALENPQDDPRSVNELRDCLADWDDSTIPPEEKRTVLITVLKHHQHLARLCSLIQQVGPSLGPVLIFDDEADQASLNIDPDDPRGSTTYRRLMSLRDSLPMHTYLQYTATPQAPLLVNIIDSLSPEFAHVLAPGRSYVGGREFFAPESRHVRVIPSDEAPTASSMLGEPPPSLLEALRVFIVGVASGLLMQDGPDHRSMLVHPARETILHEEYAAWIDSILAEWKRTLMLSDSDWDKKDLLSLFRNAYDDIQSTTGSGMAGFDATRDALLRALRFTLVREVNASQGATPPIEWADAYSWILVGGQAMDRGFTVEGLTVTYMPRGIGVGNVDTIQQRARFLGYKASYQGYCRVYLEQGTRDALAGYVDHEEDLRRRLREWDRRGLPLKEWKRAFLLDDELRPCRHQVLGFPYMRGSLSDSWIAPSVVRTSEGIRLRNFGVVRRFIDSLAFDEDPGHEHRTPMQRHHLCRNVPLGDVLKQLLLKLSVASVRDSHRNTGLLVQLQFAIERNADELAQVYVMSGGRRRRRGIHNDGRVKELFQGEDPGVSTDADSPVYPGDRALRSGDSVTVQIHMLDLRYENTTVQESVPVVAVGLPRRLRRSWIYQAQPGQDGP